MPKSNRRASSLGSMTAASGQTTPWKRFMFRQPAHRESMPKQADMIYESVFQFAFSVQQFRDLDSIERGPLPDLIASHP